MQQPPEDGPPEDGPPPQTIESQDAPIRVDEDNDSSYGESESGPASETTSLYSAITKYVYHNGRRYHSYRQGTYWGPNDENAQENCDLFHHVFSLTLHGALFLAPITSNPQRVLDIGTGTGIWAIDFADQYPSASVIATDLSPIQPPSVPPNLEFQIDDFTQPWTFRKDSFDFIHARSVFGCVANYPALYAEVKDHLKPGGWFEQTEISVLVKSEDGSATGTRLEEWGPLSWECGDKFGKSFKIAEESMDFMEQAGFVNVRRHKFKWPIGPWPIDKRMKEIGAYHRLGWDEGIIGWAMFLFTTCLGWKEEEVHVFCAQVRKDLRNHNIHAYQDMTICYGQKPFSSQNIQPEVEHEFPVDQPPNPGSSRDEVPPAQFSKVAETTPGASGSQSTQI